MIRVLELFGGIGACSKALERLGVDYEIADYVEIDKYAVKSFNAMHGTNFEPQDITEWDKDIAVDLIMHGSPCQDFSVAGRGAGGDKDSGTRSSLMYETIRIVEKLKPKYVIWENVKNLLSKKHRHNFDAYQETMKSLGYTNYYQVLNAKDYGIPQNRERVFTVSIRNDVHKGFVFPEPIPLEKKLKDMLEDEVDEKYYLSDKLLKTYQRNFGSKGKEPKIMEIQKIAETDRHQKGGVYSTDGCCPTITSTTHKQPTQIIEDCQGCNTEPFIVASRGRNPENPSDRTVGAPTEQRLEPKFDGTTNTITTVQKDNYVAIRTANKQGYDLATDGDGVDLAYPNSSTRRGRVGHGVAKTILTGDRMGVVVKKNLKTDLCNKLVKDGVVKGSNTEPKITVSREISKTVRASGRGSLDRHTWDLIAEPKIVASRVEKDYCIRKLTPKECWRLMGFDDTDFEKAAKVNSNTQLYKQAGNSIVVNVLEAILPNML